MNWYKIIKNKMFIRMSKTISNKEAKDILNGSITHPNAKIARLMAKQSANALDSIALQIAQLLIEAYSGINQASLSKVRNIVSFISDGLSVEQAIEMGTALALKSTGAETLNEGQQQLIQLLYGAFFERNGQKKIQVIKYEQ